MLFFKTWVQVTAWKQDDKYFANAFAGTIAHPFWRVAVATPGEYRYSGGRSSRHLVNTKARNQFRYTKTVRGGMLSAMICYG